MCILSGCDYLAPLGGIGLKTLHKYFLKYKTLDRVLYALRREANKLITKEYETEFIKAELTFQFQRVYCPVEKKLVSLNQIPDDISSILDLETDESFENLDFLGPLLEAQVARGIAEGIINPFTFKPFIAEDKIEIKREFIKNPKSRQSSPVKLKSLLITVAGAADTRLTMKRSFNTQSESIQQGLRSKFVDYPKYSNVRKLTKSSTKSSDGKQKQFSILNFCVPKSSFILDENKQDDCTNKNN